MSGTGKSTSSRSLVSPSGSRLCSPSSLPSLGHVHRVSARSQLLVDDHGKARGLGSNHPLWAPKGCQLARPSGRHPTFCIVRGAGGSRGDSSRPLSTLDSQGSWGQVEQTSEVKGSRAAGAACLVSGKAWREASMHRIEQGAGSPRMRAGPRGPLAITAACLVSPWN